MLLSRDELVSALLYEADRARRLVMPLALIAIGLVEWDEPESDLEQSGHDTASLVFVKRMTRILRSFDSVGKWANGEFLLLLPGCAAAHARTMAERLRDEVCAAPIEAAGRKWCVQACFGVASCAGRSPVVVLGQTRNALQEARAAGPGTIRSAPGAGSDSEALPIPVLPLEGLHW